MSLCSRWRRKNQAGAIRGFVAPPRRTRYRARTREGQTHSLEHLSESPLGSYGCNGFLHRGSAHRPWIDSLFRAFRHPPQDPSRRDRGDCPSALRGLDEANRAKLDGRDRWVSSNHAISNPRSGLAVLSVIPRHALPCRGGDRETTRKESEFERSRGAVCSFDKTRVSQQDRSARRESSSHGRSRLRRSLPFWKEITKVSTTG